MISQLFKITCDQCGDYEVVERRLERSYGSTPLGVSNFFDVIRDTEFRANPDPSARTPECDILLCGDCYAAAKGMLELKKLAK